MFIPMKKKIAYKSMNDSEDEEFSSNAIILSGPVSFLICIGQLEIGDASFHSIYEFVKIKYLL